MNQRWMWALAVAACVGIVATGCDDGVELVDPARLVPNRTPPPTEQGVYGPLPASSWMNELYYGRTTEISGPDGTQCARGGPFSFFVTPFETDRVVIHFQSGGACWNGQSCAFADGLFSPTVDAARTGFVNGTIRQGLLDFANPDNPVTGWTHVFVPYCTGDIHWGNRRTTYNEGAGNEVTIQHRGAQNVRAVLSWAERNLPNAREVLITGCSAGGYASIAWMPWIAEAFPEADIIQIGDSAQGIITDSFFEESFPAWNALELLPEFIPDFDQRNPDFNYLDLSLGALYRIAADFYPQFRFAGIESSRDSTGVFFYSAMGGEGGPEEWSRRMNASVDEIAAAAPNYRFFVGEGTYHCAVNDARLYELESDGVSLLDWFRARLDGTAVESVRCSGCVPE